MIFIRCVNIDFYQLFTLLVTACAWLAKALSVSDSSSRASGFQLQIVDASFCDRASSCCSALPAFASMVKFFLVPLALFLKIELHRFSQGVHKLSLTKGLLPVLLLAFLPQLQRKRYTEVQ